MIKVDYLASSKTITISGAETEALMGGPLGTFFIVTVGLHRTAPGTFSASFIDDADRLLPEILRILRSSGIDYELAEGTRQGLKGRADYLRAYRNALIAGERILKTQSLHSSLPRTFRRPLKPFQRRSVKHLIEIPNAANFSVPGSGKTTIVLAAFANLQSRGEVSKLFVICPRAAFRPWEEEFAECFKRKPQVARFSGPREVRRLLTESADRYELFLCTYQMLANEVQNAQRILSSHKVLLVVDESHHIKRGAGGVWFEAVERIAPYAKRRILLSGTPAPNTALDLAPQFDILWPGLDIVSSSIVLNDPDQSLENIRSALRPLYVRIRKRELKLPPRVILRRHIRMGPVQQKIYSALTAKILKTAVGHGPSQTVVRELRKSLIVRLIQASSNPSLLREYSLEFRLPPLSHAGVELERLIRDYTRYERPPKIELAVKLAVQMARQGRKVIIWNSFIHNAQLVSQELTRAGIRNVCVTGLLSTDEAEEENRENLLGRFKAPGGPMALVATTPSVGESVSLHKICHDAIYVDRTFNCGVFMQSMDRIHRLGLRRSEQVRIHVIIARDSIDDIVERRLNQKMRVMHHLLNDDVGILNLEVPDALAAADLDQADIEAVSEQLRKKLAKG